MKKRIVIIAALIFLSLGFFGGLLYAAGGYHGGYYHGSHYYHGWGPRVYIGGYLGYPYYPYYPYPYYYPYGYPSYPYSYEEPQQPLYLEPRENVEWYYCNDPKGYYPYITNCPGGWTRVVPTPPPPEKEGR
jgi:hypothetical protein